MILQCNYIQSLKFFLQCAIFAYIFFNKSFSNPFIQFSVFFCILCLSKDLCNFSHCTCRICKVSWCNITHGLSCRLDHCCSIWISQDHTWDKPVCIMKICVPQVMTALLMRFIPRLIFIWVMIPCTVSDVIDPTLHRRIIFF